MIDSCIIWAVENGRSVPMIGSADFVELFKEWVADVSS